MRSVLLVDDHPVVRQGIARILAAEIPDLALAEAVDGASALLQMRARPPHLVLLDLTLPGDNGLSLLRKIRREFPSIPVMIVSMHPADQFAQRALQAGAVGYVAKDSDPQELVQAVRAALAGGRHVPAEVQEAARLEREPPPHAGLSDREYQVLRLIGAGRTVSEIGAELGLSVKTVSTYRARILEKLELRTSAELIHYAVVNRLVS
ncbi:MAG TPA: response regulator transcription factor [Vicinamibacterales bacterium]